MELQWFMVMLFVNLLINQTNLFHKNCVSVKKEVLENMYIYIIHILITENIHIECIMSKALFYHMLSTVLIH